MYLKKIVAQGFKSFADKTTIELNNGIIGIVGPNGSGKSNVVDAVRWVLGEQSVKSLRGDGNMTDVIFSGSKSRNSSNVASVTLIFDNSDSYLSLPYTEVSIKRRVYKDGTNEYYLNNEKCRLKDVVNILLDSGIAKESFNIISQGKIEEIIASKPNERRVVFEEAAGVLKYKRRKEESLRKLEKTHSNMQRVNDIISELEIQVEPLKEQKEKAIEYGMLKDELSNIEIALVANDITNINYKYQDKKEIVEKLNNELIELSNKNRGNDVTIEQNRVEITKLERKIKEKQNELLNVTAEVEKINGQKQIILERKKYQVDDIKLHNNILELKENLLKIDTEINSVNNEIKLFNEELSQCNSKLIEEENILKQIKEQKNNIQILLTNKLKENNYNQNKIETLKQNIENNGTLPYSVRNILSNPKLKGIHNVIGNLIDTNDKYKKAISVSLGSASSTIVADNENSIKEAINYLKNNNIGRATFFPLNIIKSRTIDSETKLLIDGEKVISTADKLIKYDLKYKNIIENQFGNVIVCNNLDSANELSKKINHKYKIVTLDGELLHVGGAITGGNDSRQNNIISIKYEYEQAIKNEEKLENEIKDFEVEINNIDEKIKISEEKIYLINKEKINIESKISDKKNKNSDLLLRKDSVNLEIKGTNNLLNNSLDKEEEEILNSYYNTLNKKSDIENELNILNNKKGDLNDQVQQYEHLLKRENSIYNQKSNELKEAEIEVNRMDVKLDNLLNLLNETYNMTYEKATSLYKLELDSESARSKVGTLKKKLKDLGEVNLAAPSEYEKVSTRYEFLISQREDLVKAENTLLEIIKEMDSVMKNEFINTFNIINKNFTETFKELFKSGTAELKLTDESDLLETGIEIVA